MGEGLASFFLSFSSSLSSSKGLSEWDLLDDDEAARGLVGVKGTGFFGFFDFFKNFEIVFFGGVSGGEVGAENECFFVRDNSFFKLWTVFAVLAKCTKFSFFGDGLQ